jgi:hypothetical protein
LSLDRHQSVPVVRGRLVYGAESSPQMGWAPGGPAGIADIMAEQKGFETELGGLEIADGIFTSPAEVTDGFVLHRRDIDGGEIA